MANDFTEVIAAISVLLGILARDLIYILISYLKKRLGVNDGTQSPESKKPSKMAHLNL